MKKIILVAAMVCCNALGAWAQQSFGDVKVDERVARDASICTSLLSNKESVEDVTIKGVVKGVCQAKGCWMTLDIGNGKEMTVKFKDYAFFMPMDCAGKTVVAHGKTFLKTTSVAELKHLAEDAGKSKKEIAKIKKPKKEIRFEADGVILLD